jgi:hypothetical protein
MSQQVYFTAGRSYPVVAWDTGLPTQVRHQAPLHMPVTNSGVLWQAQTVTLCTDYTDTTECDELDGTES